MRVSPVQLSYCGPPPAPDALWARWNLDPALLLGLLAVLAVYAVWTRAGGGRRPPAWRRASFYAGWTLGALALVSPLCALSVSLFSARVGQHMLLAMLVAPLVALGLPGGGQWRGRPGAAEPPLAAAAFAATLWFWHAPGPYAATFHSVGVYWAMHFSAFAAALWLWLALFDRPGARLIGVLAAAALTSLQMGLLGAILTFAERPLYAPHALTTAAWGLSPLADQQLGGAIMWAPAGLGLVAAVVAALGFSLRSAGRRALAAS